MKKQTLTLLLLAAFHSLLSQNVSNRTDKFEISTKKSVVSTVPIISWLTPIPEISYSQEARYKVKFVVEATTAIKAITISLRETMLTASRGSMTIQPEEAQKLYTIVDKTITLMDGENVIEVIVENAEGVKSKSYRRIRVGSVALADANRIERNDYALIFATDQYDNWNDLVNPVFDSRAIAEELEKTYGFKADIVENPTQDEILKKLREYGEKKYQPLDQVFIFFAGHGTYDQTFGEGFVVTKESITNDDGKTSYLSHNRLRSIINNIPAEHIFLVMDVCFGGTFDEALASARGADDEVYKETNQNEFIARKLTLKTRRYLTSGGKTYVSDGIPGKHSPFAKSFIDALQTQGGRDGILTISEIFGFVEKLKNPPRLGDFGGNLPGSDFLFVRK
ncbi:hypothetical protein WSM22_35640 [Cytophagales bacterium WSM2-2]|nr:hypothetical protein WSM22_35640 [Cytophagales bacterium WSM2-2]